MTDAVSCIPLKTRLLREPGKLWMQEMQRAKSREQDRDGKKGFSCPLQIRILVRDELFHVCFAWLPINVSMFALG